MAIRPSRQRGFLMLLGIMFVMLAGIAFFIAGAGAIITAKGKTVSATVETLTRIQEGLIRFATLYKRLPCPADPTGVSNPGWPEGDTTLANPHGTCSNFSTGVVPWNVLGLTQDQVTDEWGRLISYRVFDGQFGLTQADGASALDCDTNNGSTADSPPDGQGKCAVDHNTPTTSYLAHSAYTTTPSPGTKGLMVDDFGTLTLGVAYVLISHGPSGLGGYVSTGSQVQPLPVTGAGDFANTRSPPTSFKKLATSAPDVVAGAAGHFDDVVAYLKIADLLKLSKLEGRNWPEVTLPSFTDTSTSNMTQLSDNPSAPHFMSSGTSGSGEEFVATTSDGNVAIQFGTAVGAYAGCAWWPNGLSLKSGTTSTPLIVSMEFAAADNSSDAFPGFTFGFVSGTEARPTNSTCGTTYESRVATGAAGSNRLFVTDTSGLQIGLLVTATGISAGTTISSIISGTEIQLNRTNTSAVSGPVNFANSRLIRRDLGWAGGTLSTYSNRFAVEFDASQDASNLTNPTVASAVDPSRPHLAIDFTGVTHGTNASSCSTYNYGSGCQRPSVSTFSAPSPSSRAALGIAGLNSLTITDAAGVTGILNGMPVTATGIPWGTTVTSISGNAVGLSAALTSSVSGAVTFSSLSSSNFMQNGLTVFHTIRAEVLPDACTGSVATGTAGSSSIDASDSTGIAAGMVAYGVGIAAGSTIRSMSGTSLTLSKANTSTVSGTVSFAWPTTISRTASGAATFDTLTISDTTGIAVGMVVTGTGIGTAALVTDVSGSTVSLSVPNAADLVSQTVTFTPWSAVKTATGLAGATAITISSPTDLSAGMPVSGTGIPTGTTVTGIVGDTVSLSNATTAEVSSVTFKRATALGQTLVKSWTLSNAGCNASPVTCAELKSSTTLFQEYLAADSQALHAASCLATPTPSNAFDSLYFGFTTANRATGSTGAPNMLFRKLVVTAPGA